MSNWPRFGKNAVYKAALFRRGIGAYFRYLRLNCRTQSLRGRASREAHPSGAERLKEFPHIAHIGLAAGTMEWTVRGLPYVIVHEVDRDAGEIIVLGVYHGAQQRAH